MPATLSPQSLADGLAELRTAAAELYDLTRVAELLGWDQETMMPAKGVSWRAGQQATIHGIYHERLTSRKLGDLVRRLGDASADERSQLSDVDRALIREIRREHDRAVKLPTELVKQLAQTVSEATATWQKAREQDDWSMFQSDLQRVMTLKQQVAEQVGYAQEPYDALLDEYEPGLTARQVDEMFSALRAETVSLLDRIRNSGGQVDRAVLEQEYDESKQWAFGETVLGWLSFDFEAGRQDRSAHPFCTHMGVGDVRVTTRVHPRDLGQALFGSMHECGHALYEQGIGEAVQRSPIGSGVSLGIHESQSRMMENFVGRGIHFWRFALPRLAEVFPDQLRGVDVETFWRAANKVQPSYIRVEADEVTYNLHILLRFEVERKLFAGQVKVDDLPALWNETSQALLGITPPTNREGLLQDIHWGSGLVGYFPTYTLGNLYAAQLWATIGREMPDRDQQIERGEFGGLVGWLRDRIHRHGGTYQPVDLIQRATGDAPSSRYLVDYLNQKYAAVYGFTANE